MDPSSPGSARCAGAPRGVTLEGMFEYEYREMTIPPRIPRAEMRALLVAEAEHGHWELARVRVYVGGRRQVSLRRKIIRVPRM